MKAITTKSSRTYNSIEMLKDAGFVFDKETKTWSSLFESKEAFDEFENKFRSVTYAGRKQARMNEDVQFEIIDEETKKADKEEQPKEKEAKTARKVGDVHPNHPTWIWTEYAEGKFDWRTNPADKKQGQRTDKAKTSAKKSEPKKKAAKKETKPVKEAPKELTIDEFVALPSKSARGNKKPSEAQKEALKLIMKGYRVTADHKFFENAEGDKKACNWDSVVALFCRYGIEYIPEGLVKSL